MPSSRATTHRSSPVVQPGPAVCQLRRGETVLARDPSGFPMRDTISSCGICARFHKTALALRTSVVLATMVATACGVCSIRGAKAEGIGEDCGYASGMHAAVTNFAVGCYLGIRNPAAHEHEVDWDEQTALEYLAALSTLARWIDKARVDISS